mmetsp:Transcript_87499/g.245697  ORF Transcript_87499/g.245697 Transcript_87499/m.245697 type:complete len:201 (+) Transcript_87499:580-1182(+)
MRQTTGAFALTACSKAVSPRASGNSRSKSRKLRRQAHSRSSLFTMAYRRAEQPIASCWFSPPTPVVQCRATSQATPTKPHRAATISGDLCMFSTTAHSSSRRPCTCIFSAAEGSCARSTNTESNNSTSAAGDAAPAETCAQWIPTPAVRRENGSKMMCNEGDFVRPRPEDQTPVRDMDATRSGAHDCARARLTARRSNAA